MNNIQITVYHPNLDLLSDRTFRDLLKKLSSLTRDFQAKEVMGLISESTLRENEKQSIRDKLKNELKHIPAYYIDRIDRGSLEVVISVTAIGIWLLQNTIGKSIEKAWQQTRFHKRLVKYLATDLRKNAISHYIYLTFDNYFLGKYLIDDIHEDTNETGGVKVRINLKTPDEDGKVYTDQKIDAESVIENGQKILQKIENQYKPDEN